jgi:hypothetical protein
MAKSKKKAMEKTKTKGHENQRKNSRGKGKECCKSAGTFKTQNNYPAEVSALICFFQIRNTDFCFQSRFQEQNHPHIFTLCCISNYRPSSLATTSHISKNNTIHTLLHKQFPAIKSSDNKPTTT